MGDVTLVIASSPYGGSLHEKLVDYLAEKDKAGLKVLDLGIHPSHVEAAYEAARAVQAAEQQGLRKKGVICCGSGQVSNF
ncbi:hypothetical protein QBZ16_005316 [Prototheca wickerhamii]|uniref:Uncharacterized protein n=1 Tax=Prototheca wickerhamii TaxID=3111 RepID=A0AAD9IFE9_PROWI|nr:hypothetical protein QBZ16_005316 [Prototheca wickerhamii]